MQPITPVTPGINPGEPLPGGTIPTDVPMPPDPVGPPDYDPLAPQPIPVSCPAYGSRIGRAIRRITYPAIRRTRGRASEVPGFDRGRRPPQDWMRARLRAGRFAFSGRRSPRGAFG